MGLKTTSQLAELTPYGDTAIINYKKRYSDFPKAKAEYGPIKLYDEDEFLDWFKKHETRKKQS